MKTKTAEEIFTEEGFSKEMMLPKHLVEMLMHKYHNQFSQLPASVPTDEQIKTEGKKRSTIMNFVDDADGKFFEECFLIGAKWMRSLLNHPPVMGEGEKGGMKELKIYEFQAKQIQDTFRIVANTLNSRKKETSLDRDVMVSYKMIDNVLDGKTDERVER